MSPWSKMSYLQYLKRVHFAYHSRGTLCIICKPFGRSYRVQRDTWNVTHSAAERLARNSIQLMLPNPVRSPVVRKWQAVHSERPCAICNWWLMIIPHTSVRDAGMDETMHSQAKEQRNGIFLNINCRYHSSQLFRLHSDIDSDVFISLFRVFLYAFSLHALSSLFIALRIFRNNVFCEKKWFLFA